jgi:H+-translocating diphosphatase
MLNSFVNVNIASYLSTMWISSSATSFLTLNIKSWQLSATGIIILAGVVGLAWAYSNFSLIAQIPVVSVGASDEATPLTASGEDKTVRLNEIYEAIYEGAESFLRAEYKVCFIFISVFSVLIFVLVSWGTGWNYARGGFTAISFLLGALTSMGSGYLGMKVAVFSNVRTTISAQKPGWTACFNTAFRAGAVMGFALCSAGLLMLYFTMLAFRQYYPEAKDWLLLTESLTGYGLGGSVIAMFGRVGGGIYTKGMYKSVTQCSSCRLLLDPTVRAILVVVVVV